ncbi:MAG TPA: carbohydrate-binding protein, partial [Ilumatobacter sp.]
GASVTIDSTGFALLLDIDVLDAFAEDFGSASVRIGPQRIRGAWASGETYFQGDVVTFGGNDYTAVRTHESANDNDPGDGTGMWRLGGGAAGSAGNPTVVTATGTGGITADSSMTSNINASPRFNSFSLFGAVGVATSGAHQDGTARATVGSFSQLSATTGDIRIRSAFVGKTEAHATGVAGAIVGVSITRADADHDPTVLTTVQGSASLTAGTGKTIEIAARHNYGTTDPINGNGALGSASNTAFGLVAGVAADVDATAAADVVTSVADGATFATTNGNVEVASYNRNESLAAVSSLAVGAVSIDAGTSTDAFANGRTSTNFDGSIGTTSTVGAGSLDVLAIAFTTSDASMKSGAGGAVTVAGGDAHAHTSPDLMLNFGTSSTTVNVSGNVTIRGNQVSDADARARGTSGGALNISDFNSSVTMNPDVTVELDDTNLVKAGGTITISAEHGGGGSQTSDGTVLSADNNGNYVTLTALGAEVPLAHQLSGGETVIYSGSCCSLQSGQAYNVIIRDGTSLYLGNTFNASSQVSTANDTITFSNEHNFFDGEKVYYLTNGGSQITGLTDGDRYSVNVIDEFTIKLLPDGQSEVSRNVSSVNGGTDVVTTTVNHGFADGLNVTYHAPGATTLFTSAMVDVASLGSAGPDFGSSFPLNSTDNNAIFAGQPNSSGTWDAHSYNTGDAVIYRNIDGDGIGLTDGVMYFVHRVSGSNFLITLHTSYCDAVGSAADSGCFLPDGGDGGSDPDDRPAGRNPVSLNAGTKTEFISEQRHSLTKAVNYTIPGLTDGATYLVDTTGLAANEFRLTTLGGVPIGISSSITKVDGRNPELGGTDFTVNLSFAGHRFAHEGINLTGTGTGTAHLRVDLTTALAGNDNGRFSGIGGAAALTFSEAGDQKSVASGSGAGGGAIDVRDVEAKATGTLDTNLNIKTGVALEASTIDVHTTSRLAMFATVDGIGGGFASFSGG